jgi:hypothetical protein
MYPTIRLNRVHVAAFLAIRAILMSLQGASPGDSFPTPGDTAEQGFNFRSSAPPRAVPEIPQGSDSRRPGPGCPLHRGRRFRHSFSRSSSLQGGLRYEFPIPNFVRFPPQSSATTPPHLEDTSPPRGLVRWHEFSVPVASSLRSRLLESRRLPSRPQLARQTLKRRRQMPPADCEVPDGACLYYLRRMSISSS